MATLAKQIMNAAKVESILNTRLRELIAIIDRNMSAHGRHVSRHTIESLRPEVSKNGIGILWGSGSFFALEKGRRGGKVPYGFYGIIKQWIQDKHLSFEGQKINSVAWFIAQKIKKEGSKMYREGTFQDIMSTAINEEIQKILDDLEVAVSSDIDYINQQFIQGGFNG